MKGKCQGCGILTESTDDLIIVSDAHYCSKRCALLVLLEKKDNLTQEIYDTIRSLKE